MGRPPIRSIHVPAGVPGGVLATITMDVAMVAAGILGGRSFTSERLGPDMIGRWAAGLLRGRWRSGDISHEPPQRGELALGLATHYVTGIALTQAFLLVPRRWRRKRSLLAATAYGISTAVLPLLVMFPSMGYGWSGLRSGEAGRLLRIMLVGHIAFGVGIGLWAPRFAERRPDRDPLCPEEAVMKKAWIVAVVVAGVALLARAVGSGVGKTDIGERIAAMPDTSPPKWIYTNVTAIRANTDRILALLEEQGRTATGEVETLPTPEAARGG